MIALVGLIDEHSEAIEYDLIRCGARLRDWPDGGVTWRDLWVLVRQAQPDTATYKALNDRWQATTEVDFLRSIEHGIRILGWMKTADATKGRNRPEPYRFPWEHAPAARHDVLDWDEAAACFGWEAEMAAYFKD